MRLLTQIICLSLFIFTSGCSSIRNPFSSGERYSTHSEKEIERRIAAGEYDNAIKRRRDTQDGGRQVSGLSEFDRATIPGNAGAPPSSVQQRLPGVSATELNGMIEELVSLEPAALKSKKRDVYRQMSPSTLRQILTGYRQANLIGQSQIAVNDLDQARDRVNQGASGNSFQNADFPDAPDPRNVAQNRPLGIDPPWRQRPDANRQQPLRMNDPTNGQPDFSPTPGGSRLKPAGGFNVPGQGDPNGGITQMSGTTGQLDRTNNRSPTDSLLPQINPGGSVPRDANSFTPGFGRDFNNQRNAGNTRPDAVQLMNPQDVTPSQNQPGQLSNRFQIGNEKDSATSTVPGIGDQLLPPNLRNGPSLQIRQDPSLRNPLNGNSQTDGTNPNGDTTPGGLPSRISSSVQNILPSIRNVAERTLPTFPGIGLGGPAADSNLRNPANGQDGLLLAIQSLEQQLASTAPGQTEAERLDYIRKHVGLRTLYIVAGRNGQALDSIPGAKPTEQEFWQQMMWSVVSYFDTQGVSNSSDRATQTIGQLRAAVQQLRARANLELNNVAFCHKIDGFGYYDRFSRDRFKSGQPILLYAEVKNFQSALVEDDRFRTVMNSGIEIYRGTGDQELLASIPFDVTEDLCRTQREDYFLAFEFFVPERLEVGTYTMVLKVEDQLSRKVTMSRLNFVVE